MANIPNIAHVHDKTGITYLRDGVLVAFFLPKPLHETVGAIADVFDLFLASVPPGAIKWAGIGAGAAEWKPVHAKTFDKCRALLAPSAARKRAMTSFELAGSEKAGDAPEYSLTLIAAKPDKQAPDEVDLVEMTFPSSVVGKAEVEHFVDLVRKMAAKLPFISGYGSPSLVYSELGEGKALIESRGLATRYPGFDVQKNKLGCIDINNWVRGARWLTLLGPDVVKKLGGIKKLRAALHKDIAVEEVGHGLMIRAGQVPEIGDRNKKIDTPLLRNLAKALEPVTLFEEPILLSSYFADRDKELLNTWERRFLD